MSERTRAFIHALREYHSRAGWFTSDVACALAARLRRMRHGTARRQVVNYFLAVRD